MALCHVHIELCRFSIQLMSLCRVCSCFGTVLSLNGEAEPSVYVEAVTSETSPSSCRKLQEESQTEVDGSFRIRGLQVNILVIYSRLTFL